MTVYHTNNALVYPGVGFGAIAVKSRILTEKMLANAAHALADIVDDSQEGAAVLPPVSKLPEFSQKIAEVVAQTAIDDGLTRTKLDAKKAVLKMKWIPEY